MRDSWTKIKLGSIGKTYSGLSGKTKGDFGAGSPYIPYLRIFESGRIDTTRFDYVKIHRNEKQNKVEFGDLFFTTSSETIEEVGMTSVLLEKPREDTYLNSFCFGFRLNNFEILNPNYASYLFRSKKIRKTISLIGQGSTRYNLPKTILFEKLKIELPPLPTQRKIAKILNTADSIIEKTEAAIAKYRAIKQGMMQDLFTRGLDLQTGQLRPSRKEAPHLYRETELGWIPREWKIGRLDSFCEVKGGKRLPAGEEFSDVPTPFPYVRVSDMKNGSVDLQNIVFVKESIEPLIRRYKISANDLYITIAGTLGLVGTIPKKLDQAQLTENAAKLVLNHEKVKKEFLKYFFQSSLFPPQLYREVGIGGGVPKLALHRIESFVVPILQKDEQQEIAARISRIDILIQKEQLSLAKHQSLKKGLMQDLLTGKVEVEV